MEFQEQERGPSAADIELVTLLCDNVMLQEVLQKFGPEIEVRKKKNNRQFIAKVAVSPALSFFAWVFQCEGRVGIEDPEHVLERYCEMIDAAHETTTEFSDTTKELFEAVPDLPDGTEITTGQLLRNCGYNLEEFDDEDLIKLHEDLLERVEISNSSYYDSSAASKSDELVVVLSEPANENSSSPWDLTYFVFNNRKRPICPFCGDPNTARILYGKPALHGELQKIIESGRLAFGGCLRNAVAREDGSRIYMDPQRHCNHCDREFAYPAFWQDENHLVNYADTVESIKYKSRSRILYCMNWTITKNQDGAAVKYDCYGEKSEHFEKQITKQEWKTFLHKVYDENYLHEWEREYINLDKDGWSWDLEVTLEGDIQHRYQGSNCEPPYLKKLKNLFWSADCKIKLNK